MDPYWWCVACVVVVTAGQTFPRSRDRAAWLANCDAETDEWSSERHSQTTKRVAVVFWGESFRNSGRKGERSRCARFDATNSGWAVQRVIYGMHLGLFARLHKLGYDVDVFGATKPCTNETDARRFEGAAVFAHWYRDYLRAPLLVLDEPNTTVNAGHRHRVAALGRLEEYVAATRAAYSHVMVLRWDLSVFAKYFPECLLSSHTLLDSTKGRLGNTTDWDRALLVPRRFVSKWLCLLKSDAAWLEPAATCQPGAASLALELGTALAPACCCDPGFAGPPPNSSEACWTKQCGWDVCLGAFPLSARTLPPACRRGVDAVFASGKNIVGVKILRSKASLAIKLAQAVATIPSGFGQLTRGANYSVRPVTGGLLVDLIKHSEQ